MPEGFLVSFVGRLKARDPSAIATLRKLAHLHFHGHAKATAALHKIAALHASPQIGASHDGMGFAPVAALTGLLANVAHLSGKILGTAGHLLEKTGTLAAKPFHYAEQKLGGNKAIHFLPAHH